MQADVTGLMDVVGREEFLNALGDPEMRICILDKLPTTMDESLHIALNIEALEKSRDTHRKVVEPMEEYW